MFSCLSSELGRHKFLWAPFRAWFGWQTVDLWGHLKHSVFQTWRAAATEHSVALEQLMVPAVHPGASQVQADKPHGFPHSPAGGLMESASAFVWTFSSRWWYQEHSLVSKSLKTNNYNQIFTVFLKFQNSLIPNPLYDHRGPRQLYEVPKSVLSYVPQSVIRHHLKVGRDTTASANFLL